MESGFFEESFVGVGELPEGQLLSEEELREFEDLPAALSEEEEIVGVDEGSALLRMSMGQPVQVDITRFPFRAIVYLDIFLNGGFRRRGSAFFVTPHVLATAGHNLRFSFSSVTRVDVIVALHGTFQGAVRYTAHRREVHPLFIPNSRDRDVGIVRLVEDVGRATGFFALADVGSFGTPIHVSGYPITSFFQTASAGIIQSGTTATRLQYDAETHDGHSGGGVWIPRLNPAEIVAVGVHTHGLIAGDTFNSGVRMTSDVRSWILSFA